jgi:hypothetical protein
VCCLAWGAPQCLCTANVLSTQVSVRTACEEEPWPDLPFAENVTPPRYPELPGPVPGISLGASGNEGFSERGAMPDIVLGIVLASLFMILCAAVFFRSSSRSHNHHYRAVVPSVQSYTSPLVSQEIRYDQPSLEVQWTRDSTVTNWQTGETFEQHDEVFVKGPPDAAMYTLAFTEQAAHNFFPSSAYAVDPPSSATYALEPPEPAPDIPLLLTPDQYEELPGSPTQNFLDWQQTVDNNLPSGWYQ